jgi:hypothetical protein
MNRTKKDKNLKESPLRSLSKAFSWRVIASLTTL